jgi:NADPH2:quinone reductase
VQVAKAYGARVIATSTGHSLDACKNYGADHLIDYASTSAWDKEVMKLTSGHGVDMVFDPVGMISQCLKCAAFDARLVCIGFVGGEIEAIKMNRILLKNVSVVGLHWGAYVEFQPETIGKVWEGLFELIREGRFKSTVFEERYAGLKDVGRGLKTLEDKQSWGKVVVDVESAGGSSKL